MNTSDAPTDPNLLVCRPGNVTAVYGDVAFGVEPPTCAGSVDGPGFAVSGMMRRDGTTLVYGLLRKKGSPPQVWTALTDNGMEFHERRMLFEVPDAPTPWLAGDVARAGEQLLLLICACGSPPESGHLFHPFGGSVDGDGWTALAPEHVYRGQDAFGLVRNEALGRFVNYQTTYQPFEKRYPDNMPNVRRVLHIRTSPDGVAWTPGGSFGVAGPHLPEEQMIPPDDEDAPETEFYKFRAFPCGDVWAGVMVKYASQPSYLPKSGNFPHGPFLGLEWWLSDDGLDWRRPFRTTSGLEGVPLDFAYRLTAPFMVGDEMRFPVGDRLYTLDRRRMFFASCRANAEIETPTAELSGRPVEVDLAFGSVERGESGPLVQGYVAAELLDEDGRIIPGFEREACVFLPDESTRLTLAWNGRSLPESPKGKRVRLRLCFRDAKIHSVSF